MFNRIECQLEYVFLEDCPEFAALSYVWGDPNDKVRIILNGKEFLVTRNLYKSLEFLTGVHNDGEKMLYWIDAICINQTNVQERSGQVLRMRDIYGSAKLVFAFLGDSSSELVPSINM
ncbi:heterokaryon incompatibility protein-domain-containing protein, partial [Tricladium varicosporioides]